MYSPTADGYVIYDCDIGTDDAWGLQMLIKGEEMETSKKKQHGVRGYKILAVTCVQGNTDVENGTMNALRVLNAAGRRDIPIYKGCDTPLLPPTWKRTNYFHGRDGFGDLEHNEPLDYAQLQEIPAVDALYEFACKYPRQVDYLLVGPNTNFASAIQRYGVDFLDKVRDIYIMGGNCKGKGNITKSAEFNFYMDPEAAALVLESVQRPLTLLPWESCIDSDLGITLDWRLNVLGQVENKFMELLNRAEHSILVPKGVVNWIVCDAMLVAAYVVPQVVTQSRLYHATVELNGRHTRGQVVLDHLRREKDNADIVMTFDKSLYKRIISWTAGMAADI